MRTPSRSLLLAALVIPAPATALALENQPPPPNILLIVADDQGWGDLSLHGNTNLATPHIDSLARQGARFDRFFVQPVCAPTRAEILTGRYFPRTGVSGVSAGEERMNLDERTIADTLRSAGYATGAFGKWHNGTQYPYHPNGRGFDEFYGFCSGHWGQYFDWELEHNGETVRGNGFLADDSTDRALAFMEANRDQRFLCLLAFNTPHSPMQVPDRFYESFRDKDLGKRHLDPAKENIPHTRAALAMCENIDWNVGRILERMDTWGIAEDTLVLYMTDNGPNGWRWNDGMRGRKGSTDEGGVRSMFLARWPGRIQPGIVIKPIAGAIDLMPTFRDLARIQTEPAHPLDGKSLAPLLLRRKVSWPDRMLFSSWRGKVSARTERFRLDDRGRLYDMTADPGQARDVADEHPEETARLRNATREYEALVRSETRSEPAPFPVGHRTFPLTVLPARDGVAHGNVQRSNKYPNCSYFTHWMDTEASVTWDIEVATTGTYEAELRYACPPRDVGAVMALERGDRALSHRITVAHDPPDIGADDDRTPRGESYVKDFKTVSMGEIRLDQGRAPLTLRATRIPGERAAEIYRIRLRLTAEPGPQEGPPADDNHHHP